MKTKKYLFGISVIIAGFLFAAPLFAEQTADSQAADTQSKPSENQFSGSLTPAPLQYAFVSGDQGKFRQNTWTREGYDGGFEDFEFEEVYKPLDLTAIIDGHAMIHNEDYEVNAVVEKKNLGYVKLEYQEYTKYYDDLGGVFYPFNDLQVNALGRDLGLDIGHLRIETGLTHEGFPGLMFAYQRSWKNGQKSRLTWGTVTVNGLGKNIYPSYQYVDEIVDTFELEETYTLKGIELKGQQVFESSSAELQRQEQSWANNSTASNYKGRTQFQDPQYQLFSTTESGERWFKDDTVYAGTAYHFTTLKNNEVENIFETNQNGRITNFSNPKQIRNARADNEYNDNVWTASFLVMPVKWLQVDSKLRTELMDRSGNSSYPSDSTPAAAGGAIPDGVINTTELSRTEDRLGRVGEGVALRITGIPKTALYNEFEFEQLRNWLSEDRTSQAGQSVSNASEVFGRETLTYMSRGIWTIGAQVVPWHWLNWTGHFRFNRANSDYDDERETAPTATGAKSAFMDAFNTQSEELATRVTFKVRPWLKPSFRYKFQIKNYFARAENLENVGTDMVSNIFAFEVAVQPLHNLLIVSGVSPTYSYTKSPLAANEMSGNTPRFQANYLSWLLNSTYEINKRFSWINSLEYSQASNFNDVAPYDLPLGAAYYDINISSGLDWKISKLITQTFEYAFLRYNGDDRVDAAEYNGHVISTRTKFSWG